MNKRDEDIFKLTKKSNGNFKQLQQDLTLSTEPPELIEAKLCLADVRMVIGNNAGRIELLRKLMVQIDASPEDIGTSEEELTSLLAKGFKVEAIDRINLIENRQHCTEDDLDFITTLMIGAGFPQDEIDETMARLAKYKS
jgi:hypothetical protein